VYLSVAEVSPLYFVNSLRPCFLSSRLRSLFAFSVVLFLSYVSPFPSLSFSVVPSLCYVAVFCCRFPTIFRQFSPSLFAFSVILSLSYVSPFHSWFCQSFFLFLTSLLYICLSMSYSHCILSIISDSVCFFCRSFSFFVSSFLSLLPQSFFLLLTSLLCICLSMSYSHCISSILSDFVCLFCRSLSFLRQFFPYFVFLCRCFPFLRHCCVFVCRCSFPTVFRQFFPSLFAFYVILSLSYVSPFHSLLSQSFFLLLT